MYTAFVFLENHFCQADIIFHTNGIILLCLKYSCLVRILLGKKWAYCVTLSWIRLRDGFLRVDLVRRTEENVAAKCTSSNGTRTRERSLSAPKCTWKFVLPCDENKSVRTSPNGKNFVVRRRKGLHEERIASTIHMHVASAIHMSNIKKWDIQMKTRWKFSNSIWNNKYSTNKMEEIFIRMLVLIRFK